MPNAICIKKLFIIVILAKITSTGIGWFIKDPVFFGFVIPITIMLVYIVIGMRRRDRDELSDEKFADSCYYLGFIFTISSIIVCLFDLPSLEGTLSDIAIRFGAAMVSTVIGLIVRVWLVNFRKDTYDIVSSVEDELLEAAKALRINLDMAVQKLGEFTGIVDEASKTAAARVNMTIEEGAANYSEKFSKLFDQIAGENKKASEEAIEHTKKSSHTLANLIEGHTEALAGNTNDFRVRLEDFASDLHQRLQQVKFPEEYFVEELAGPVSKLKESISVVSDEVGQTVSGLRGGSDKVSRALVKISENASRLSDSMEKSKTVIDAQHEVIGLAKAQLETFTKLSEIVGRLEATIDQSVESHRKQDELLGKMVTDVAGVATSHDTIIRHSGIQIKNIDILTQNLTEIKSALLKLNDTMPSVGRNVSVGLIEGQEKLGEQASDIKSSVEKMATDLKSMVAMNEKGRAETSISQEPSPGGRSFALFGRPNFFSRASKDEEAAVSNVAPVKD